jgi:hypothetical protein
MSPKSQNPQPLTRRTFLRAIGATLALPFLEARAPQSVARQIPSLPRDEWFVS